MEDELKDEGTTDEGGTEEVTTEESTTEEGATENIVEESSTEAVADEGYQFDDDLTSSDPTPTPAPASTSASTTSGSHGGGGGDGRFADEIFSKTIHAKFRTFYIDLKESSNGKFVKISEKSRGRKSTVMMDSEDVPAMIEALQEVQKQL